MATEATPLDLAPATKPEEQVAAPETAVPKIVEPAAEEPVVPAVETKTEEPAKTEEITAVPDVATAPAHIEKAADQPIEPISEGLLHYKAPAKFPMNLIPGRDHQYLFWFGDAAVPADKLTGFTFNSKADFAQEASAWSSQTGKGLLYYAKSAEHKDSPTGVFPLSEATDVKESGIEFSFKINDHKHVFSTSNATERSGWVKALKAEIEAAAGKKAEIHGSEGFISTMDSFKAPAAAQALNVPKKSTDIERTTREEKTTSKSKSRSVSRGKGIFDRFNKKDAAATEGAPVATTETPAVAPEAEASTAGPATIPTAVPAPAPVETAEPVAPAAVSANTETAPVIEAATMAGVTGETEKPTIAGRRSSRFGDFFKKVTSPTTEKKEADIVPTTSTEATKEGETTTHAQDVAARVLAAPVVGAETAEATAAAPVAEGTETAAPASEVVTPTREKKKFSLPNLFEKKAKSPATDAAPVAESSEVPAVVESTPTETETVKPVEAAPAVADAETKAAAPVSPVEKTEKRRSSFFSGDIAGSIKKLTGQKKAADAEAVKESEEVTAHPPAHVSNDYTHTATPRTDLALNMAKDEADKAHDKEELKEAKKEEKKAKGPSAIMRRISTAIRSGSKERKVSPTHPAKVEEDAEKSAIAEEAPKLDETATVTKPTAEEVEPVAPVADSTTPAAFHSTTANGTTPLAANNTVSTAA